MADSASSTGPSLPPVGRDRSALTNGVYENLLDALIDGRLAPGDRLVMDRLADDLGVSRSPVRDALLRLHREGVVEPAGRRGYIVREASDQDIHDFYSARMAVEGFSAELLAEQGPKVLSDLRLVLKALAAPAPQSVRESFEANRKFHRAIVEATGNSYLTDMFDSIWNRSRTALTYKDFARAYPSQDFECEHVELLDALEGASKGAAHEIMVDHITSGLDRTVTAPALATSPSGS